MQHNWFPFAYCNWLHSCKYSSLHNLFSEQSVFESTQRSCGVELRFDGLALIRPTTMRDKLDILALVLGTLGFICLAYSVLFPRWYVGDSSGVGPWMHCDWAAGLRCGMHVGIFLGIFILLWIALSALLISGFAMCGTNCCGTSCCHDNAQKKLFAAGCLYLISCLVTLGPVTWVTWILAPRPSVIGECLYLAWVSVGLLMAAGVLQLHRYSPCRRKEEVTHNCTPPLDHKDEVESNLL
ncbi:claudin-17-like [Engraulis encrasicolus]|uniref:claudin-17-like n=1 Tax=Engraulis encrasicolus TaxID=184585 RepID=UPI002FD74894